MSPSEKHSEKEADAADLLRTAQRRFGSLIGSLPVGIAIISAGGTIESINPAIARMFGYVGSELVGQDIRRIITNCPWSNSVQFKEWCLANGDSTVEVEGRDKDGDHIPVDLTIRRLDGDGLERSVACVQDVTQRYLANKLKQEFYEMINHDIRSPLAGIGLALETMLDSPMYGTLTESGRASMQLARRNVDHIETLVSGLLELDRLEANRDNLQLDLVPARKLVAESLATVKQVADNKGISVVTQVDDVLLVGDQMRLVQVVVNLLSNAIAYTPEGQSLEVVAGKHSGCVRVAIRDRGPGIPDAEKPTIFERFKQGTNKKSQGYGLGLAICKTIIRQHGGTIGCDDAPGGGTIFWFELPATDRVDNQSP